MDALAKPSIELDAAKRPRNMADIKVSPPVEQPVRVHIEHQHHHDPARPPPPPPPQPPSSTWSNATTDPSNLAPDSTATSDGPRSRSTSSSHSSNRADSLGSSGLWDDATGSSSTSPDSEYAPKPIARRTSLSPLGASPDRYWSPTANAHPPLPMHTATPPDPRATPLASSAGFTADVPRAATYPPHQPTGPREVVGPGAARPRSPPPSTADPAPSWSPRLASPEPWQADDRPTELARRRSSGILKHHLPTRRRAGHDDDSGDATSPPTPDLLGHLEDFGVRVVDGGASGHSTESTSTIDSLSPPHRPAALPREHSSRPSLVSPTASRNLSNQLLTRSSDGDKSPAETVRPPSGPRLEAVSPAQLGGMIAASRAAPATDAKGKDRDTADRELLVIDARKLDDYLGRPGRLLGSVNVNFPSLLIKRFRRKACLANFRLDSFVTTELGKDHLHALVGGPDGSLSSVDICVVDDELAAKDVADPPASAGTGLVLVGVLDHLAREQGWSGRLCLLDGRFDDLHHDAESLQWITRGEAPDEHSAPPSSSSAPKFTAVVHSSPTSAAATEDPPTRKHGLLRLRPSGNLHQHDLPRLDGGDGDVAPKTPLRADSEASADSFASTASSPAYLGGDASHHAGGGSLPASKTKQKLRRIDTSESLLGSGSRPAPKRAPTPLSISSSSLPASLGTTATTTPPSSRLSVQEMCRSQARARISPGGNFDPPVGTAPPTSSTDSPASSTSGGGPSSSSTQWVVSTVIPGFLYLGGEPKKPSDYEELEGLGVQRILNVAVECTEEEDECRRRFKAWDSISLYDNVEEAGVQDAIERCNTLLDDASLHSAPTFLHCVAGKSRSVTIAIAYLMHRRGWSLQQAYGHVSDCRRGVSPNIGFVAELLRFEEKATSRPHARREDSRDAGGGGRATHRSLADPGRTQSLGSFNAVLMSVARSHHQRRDSTPLARSSSSSSPGTTSLAGLMDRRKSEGSPTASPMTAL